MAATPTSIPPLGAPLPRIDRGHRFHSMDRLFGAVLAISLCVHVSAYLALAQAPVRAEEPTLEEIPDRFARLLIPERRPEPKRKKEEAPKAAPAEKAPEARKEEVAEAKRDAPPEPVDVETPERKAARAAAVARAVQSKGILKVLGSLGGGASAGTAVASVFGSGESAATDVAAALSGTSGVAVAADPATTAARRGGGESAPARIGDLAPRGEPPPARVSLGVKSEVAVTSAVAVEEAEVDSAEIDQAKLGAFIRARMGLVKACYENQLKRDPGLRGKVRIRFTILETGALDEIVAIENGLGSPEVVSCIVGTMRAWRTPFRPSETVTVEHGFLFSAS